MKIKKIPERAQYWMLNGLLGVVYATALYAQTVSNNNQLKDITHCLVLEQRAHLVGDGYSVDGVVHISIDSVPAPLTGRTCGELYRLAHRDVQESQ